jgi:hypothetical protein
MRRGAAVGIFALVFAAAPAVAEDVTPAVSPDRIEDVPSTKLDPFPAFANFAWRAFVALSWPALTEPARRGEPDRGRRLADPGPRVWETFKSRYEVFPRDSEGRPTAPALWASYGGANPCGAEPEPARKTLATFSPFADFNQASFSPGRFLGPLVAQNRTYVRYEIRVNEAEFRSLVEPRVEPPSAEAPARFPDGSIAVKAAWRLLTSADAAATRARYYVVEGARVVDVAATLRSGVPTCVRADVALVGLHIAIKTKYRPQWIWSTFEHTDNVPPMGPSDAREPDARHDHAPYAFYGTRSGRAALSSPEPPVSIDNPPLIDPEPTQVIRKHPIQREIMEMNRAYWALPEIAGTVWRHYMLVATQWPTVTQPPGPDNDGRYFPGLTIEAGEPRESYQGSGDAPQPEINLANVVIETFAQDRPASCMACHHAVANARGLDFVTLLPEAR